MNKQKHVLAYALGHIDAAYIAEAELPALTAAAACPCRARRGRQLPRFWESGWFAAAISGLVAAGVLAFIVIAGQRAPAGSPAGTLVPSPAVTESAPDMAETAEPIPPYTEGLEYRELNPKLVEVVGIGSATDATVIHIPPRDGQGRDVLGVAKGAFAGNTQITEVVFFGASTLSFFVIDDAAFEGCTSLRRVLVCDNITGILFSPGCFKDCSSLTELDYRPKNDGIYLYASSMEGTPWLESQTDELVIFNGILLKYQGSAAHVALPDAVRRIGGGAFDGCHTVTSVTASEGSLLRELGYQAFMGADSLKIVELPNLEILEGTAFNDCPALETVSIPLSVLHLLPDPPDNAAVFLYAGTREDWDRITFYNDESKAKWEARVIFQSEP